MQIYKSMPLGDIIREYPTLIPIVGRFGIRPGLGEATVGEMAAQHGVDTDFFVMVLNTYLNESYFPEKRLQAFHISQIIDYLNKTNSYYLRFQLPNIEKHLRAFISMSRVTNNSLELLGRQSEALRAELTAQIAQDSDTDFPAFLALARRYEQEGAGPLEVRGEKKIFESNAEQLLSEMQNILIRFLTGDYDENLCYAVIFALNSMERDIRQHNRIRHRILYPIVEAMKNSRRL